MLENMIDVRVIAPKEKHATIFKTWDSLCAGESMLLLNDHDPLPLYYQLSAEHAGEFRWDYLESGPDVWRVRIQKGNFPDPGFIPARKKSSPRSKSATPKPLLLDTRPIFERGENPCDAIDDSVAALQDQQPFVILVPFEPVPLYSKLRQEGFTHRSEQLQDGTWRVEFVRGQ